MRFSLSLALAAALTAPVAAQPTVAPTDAKTPADERASFKVPPGFEVQLVAAEPDIGKPIQIAFDARGRLWATTSRHYPFAAIDEKPSDKLFVLSYFGPDGKAKKVTTFADDLNIPIGILPLPDCNSCLVSHIGSILKLTDTDGDGKADKRETLLTGFGSDDTHGMTNSFVLLPDGWVYATHGFRNSSVVKAKDGSEVKMQSGNTYRFRPDGSRIEPWTYGQVNPFGMTVDPWLNLYTADCHSKPITQLIRGATYQSFGKPHDGLGYAPHVTDHSHGSTGLCGLAWYEADHFPKEYRGCMFLGNVVTNRINGDRIEWKGGTPVPKELPDFLTSSDPWFRPTDIKLGPDGALYVADFYNKIIGHYEVDLKHPGRDKDRGRVWRIVYKGEPGASATGGAKPPEMARADWTKATTDELGGDLISPNLTVRLTAANELARRWKADAKAPTPNNLNLGGRGDAFHLASIYVGLIAMAAQSGGAADAPTLEQYGNLLRAAKTSDKQEQAQLTGMLIRALGSRPNWGATERGFAAESLAIDNAFLRRAAVDGMIANPHADFIVPLVELLEKLPADDNHLRHATRIGLRNAIRDGDGWGPAGVLADRDVAGLKLIVPLAQAVRDKKAAEFLVGRFSNDKYGLKYKPEGRLPLEQYLEAVEFIGRNGDAHLLGKIVTAYFNTAKTPEEVENALRITIAGMRGVLASGQAHMGVGNLFDDTKFLLEAVLTLNAKPSQAQFAIQLYGLFADAFAAMKDRDKFTLKYMFDRHNEAISGWMSKVDAPVSLRVEAFEIAVKHHLDKMAKPIGAVLADGAAPPALREKVVLTLAADPKALEHNSVGYGIREVLKTSTASYKFAQSVAVALAGSKRGAEILFQAVSNSQASARLLQDRLVLEKLRAIGVADLDKRVADLTKGIPPLDQKIANLLKQRAAGFAQVKPNLELGKAVFTKHCATCHQIANQGQKVGPQLDGIGNRGLDRLLEDVLDPSRNVDAAFNSRVVNMKDGRTIIGLSLRMEGKIWVLADSQGKEIRVSMDDIESHKPSPLSPMPANVDTAVPEAEFYQLMAYLLSQRAK